MLWEKVYGALAKRPGEYLSGQEMSARLGVSRAAVWKAVEHLRRAGYAVEARTGRGYCVTERSDRLTEHEVAVCFSRPRENCRVLAQVDSTNSECRRLAASGAPDGTVVIADSQTAGRGRRGRAFLSPPGQGLYLSVLWRPDCTPEALLPLTALAAVAVCRAVEHLSGGKPRIKWPNDLVLGGRKICGILTELSLEGESGQVDCVVVGIGVNCRQREEDFPGELTSVAGSLDMALSEKIPRPALAAAIVEELDELRREVLFHPERWLESYRSRCLSARSAVQVVRNGEYRPAQALGIDERFGLRVRYEDGAEEILRSGEVSVRGLYGYV